MRAKCSLDLSDVDARSARGAALSHVVTPRRAATLRVAGASEGSRFAAAGPNNVRQARQLPPGGN